MAKKRFWLPAVALLVVGTPVVAQAQGERRESQFEVSYFGGYGRTPSETYLYGGAFGFIMNQPRVTLFAELVQWEGATLIVCDGSATPCTGVRPRGRAAFVGARIERRAARFVPHAELLAGRFSRFRVSEPDVASFTWAAGAGVAVRLTAAWGLRLQGRYTRASDQQYEELVGEPLRYVTAVMGLWHRFSL